MVYYQGLCVGQNGILSVSLYGAEWSIISVSVWDRMVYYCVGQHGLLSVSLCGTEWSLFIIVCKWDRMVCYQCLGLCGEELSTVIVSVCPLTYFNITSLQSAVPYIVAMHLKWFWCVQRREAIFVS
eukprot:TRINITY_DN18023_c0_g1_i14.p2 TRINITY_DN18023_c0_g1~~TRINITY_DN18023_c0_g1_i14.p2  ORF type:complete len:126 (+),score=5.89 TRINITY_DN18023_c0_g1_i14:86-463(+)